MPYPLSESFATAPASGYTTVLGSMSASHNAAQQSIDLSAPNGQSILRFNETAHGDFWFEADVELLSDPSGRKHIGLWMTTGNAAEGYRFAHLDGSWSVSRWNGNFGDGSSVTPGINDGAKPMVDLPGVAPGFNVGERHLLRCEVIVGAFDATGVPWARLMQFSVDGVAVFQVSEATYRGKLIPGVFLYGAAARVHAIAGDTPSGLPAFPPSISVNADDLARWVGGPTSVLPDPSAQIAVSPDRDLLRLHRPSSDHWDDGGGYDWRKREIPSARKNIHFSGHGFIAGTVKEKGQPDQPLVRRVQLFSDQTRVLVAQVWSDPDGHYRFDLLDPDQRYTVVSDDYRQLYRAVIADNLRPQPTA
jgi:hypothetical protein